MSLLEIKAPKHPYSMNDVRCINTYAKESLGFRGFGFRVQGFGGFGFRVTGFRVQGLGFRVYRVGSGF